MSLPMKKSSEYLANIKQRLDNSTELNHEVLSLKKSYLYTRQYFIGSYDAVIFLNHLYFLDRLKMKGIKRQINYASLLSCLIFDVL